MQLGVMSRTALRLTTPEMGSREGAEIKDSRVIKYL